jgi:subtilase family serine protease
MTVTMVKRQLTGILAAAGAMSLIAAGTASAAPATVRVGDAAPHPAGSQVLASTASANASALSKPMAVTIALKPRHAAQLTAYAGDVGKPGSIYYRDYLTAAQFRSRYAPSEATLTKVKAELRSTGLTVRGVTANHLGIRLTGTGAQVQKAFSIRFLQLRLANGRIAMVNQQAPAVARSIASEVGGVVGLSGLETLTTSYVKHPSVASASTSPSPIDTTQPSTGGPVACKAAVAAEKSTSNGLTRGEYTGAQVANYYDLQSLYRQHDLGQGITVALYELEWDSNADIAAYQKCYGTHTKINYVNVDGGPGKRALKNNPDGSGEAALDIEQFVSLAPKVHLLVYRGPNANADNPGSGPYDTDAEIIGQDKASVVSTSWGECEPLETYSDAAQEDVLYQEAAVQGQTITAAAGDDGSEDCDGLIADGATALTVDDPGSQPWVISAGGTSLDLTQTPNSEVVWNDSIGGGGGGISQFWAMPAFQKDAPAGLGVINSASSDQPGCSAATGYCREDPDITGSADPEHGYLNYYNGNGKEDVPGFDNKGWIGVGGTSAVAPLWSAIFALTEASKACSDVRLGFADPALYRLAGISQDTYFTDITSGNNDWTGKGKGLFAATAGYDLASGLGSPRVTALAPALCGQTIKVVGTSSREFKVGQKVNLSLAAQAPTGAGGVVWHAHGLPAGLTLKSNVVSGTLKRAQSTHVVFTATADGSSKKVPAGYYGALGVTWTVKK